VLVPVAVALWASVSADTDKALASNLDKNVRLRPTDWASGDNLWLMAVAGERRAIPKFLQQLHETQFKGRQVKMRLRGADGKATVKILGQHAKSEHK
jgi:hemolysin-activating ACP:hemolysin acyltransferase